VILQFTDRIRASRLESQSFPGNAKQVTALCSLLRGHSYGLLLARRFLEQGDFDALLRKLAEQPPKKRFDTMMRLAVEALEKTDRGARALLERMALFTEPISEAIVERCWEDASRKVSGLADTALDKLLAKAVDDRFVLRVLEDEGNGSPTHAYVVHSSLRGHFRRRDSPSLSLVLPDFAMPGYTARTNGVDPGSARWAKRAESLFEILCEDWEDCLVPPRRGRGEGEGRVRNLSADAAECSRAAFGILRTQWECITAARQKNFDDYVRLGIRLTNRARVASPRTWSYCDPTESENIETEGSPLFIAELAWLYNDVAFGLFSEGLLPDAFAVWEQAYEVSRVLESIPPYGEYVTEALLNMTHTLIELGQMADAVQYLDEAARLNAFLQDDEVGFRIMGFRGFCEHVRGSLRRADELYRTAIAPLAQDGNRRAASFFLNLHSGVALELGDVERAAQLARESRALAEIGDYPDLVGYARIPEADVLVHRGDYTEARRGYEAAVQDADRMNARALEAFGRLKLADLSLVQGDAEGARRLAMKTLKTSNALGLGLMATRTLITLARATVHSGDRELGLGYLKIAKQQARRQQYGLRLRDAERYLRELGTEEPDRPRPPGRG
jgi:tetratricopeptide (TPR) repeat protein